MVERLEAKLPPGSHLGHFEIQGLIGAGGMGVVFSARDVRLGRRVALKVLSNELFDDEHARVRFLREAQLASTLSHPNVATVYEVDETEGIAFIAMELVEGRDLKRILLESGRLALEDAVDAGIQVCDALAAAHEAGIIHRDIKSSNIMLSPSGKFTVLDFGLAKGLSALRSAEISGGDSPTRAKERMRLHRELEPSLAHTNPGVVVGTPNYMSPEQASGGMVDRRSDIFSLGVVLYELVSGELPFSGSSEEEVLDAVRTFEPTPLHVTRREIPGSLSRTVSKCLAKNPSERFQSAPELLEALQRVKRGSLATSLVTRVIGPSSRSRRTWLIGLGAAALLLAGVATLVDLPSQPSFRERDWVLIGDFDSVADDPRLGDALGAAFRIGLEQSPYANVFPQRAAAEALKRMRRDPGQKVERALGAEICLREGLRALILGQVVQIGSSYKLSAEIVEPSTERTVLVESRTVESRQALLGGIESLAEAVRMKLGESLATVASVSQPLERVTSGSLEALHAFSQGMKEMASANDAEAIKFFERALELDPEFAMAHARAGLAYYTTGIDRRAALEHWRRALEYVDRLTEYEKLYVRASAAQLTQPSEALRLWSMMRSLYPASVVGHHNAAVSYWYFRNDFARAREGFEAAARTGAPRSFVSVDGQGYMELGLGRFALALERFQEARQRGGHPLSSGLADALIAMARYEEASEVLREAESSSILLSAREARSRRGALLLDRGELSAARRLYEEILQSSGSSPTRWTDASRVALAACDEAEGETSLLLERLRQDVPRTVESIGSEDESGSPALLRLGLLTKMWLRNFGVPGSEAALGVLREHSARLGFAPGEAYAGMLRAETLLAEGDPAGAERETRQAISLVDLFQLHETLARVHRAQGRLEDALAQYRWILEHRGQVFAESSGEWSARELSLLDWVRAHFRAAELEEQLGRGDDARALYQAFFSHWENADFDLEEIHEARRRAAEPR